MVGLPFLDANIFLRHLTQDHAELSPRATALMRRVEVGELTIWTADTVLFETVYTLQRSYGIPRPEIRAALLRLLALPGVQLRGKRRYRRIFELYVNFPALSFADCYHVALVEGRGLTDLISFDRKLRQVPTIQRKEPDTRGELA
jgi:predicted nucleic acid-binding protein